MNDAQPKPATDWATETTEYCPISGEDDTQPKPTGEWTVDDVRFELSADENGFQRIADAHNAAVAAERKVLEIANLELDQLRKQLAAERDRHSESRIAVDQAELRSLREKVAERNVAYEKGRHHNDVAIADPLRKQRQQLREQLAAEREKARAGGWLSQEALDEYAKVEEEHRQFERTLEAAYENHRADVARINDEFAHELGKKLEQINAQAKTIRELVDALKQAYSECEGTHFRVAQQTISSALAKVQSYPLPDGRTK